MIGYEPYEQLSTTTAYDTSTGNSNTDNSYNKTVVEQSRRNTEQQQRQQQQQ